MTKYVGLQSGLRDNTFRSIMLVILFPVFLFGLIFIISFLIYGNENAIEMSINSMIVGGPIILIRGIISFIFHRQLIFTFSGAKPITRKEYPEIYNIVENLCISRGLSMPKIGILEDDSYNAFAIGRNIKDSRIVFSRGIINKLDKREIEAVAGHELTHIINKDSLLMIIIVVFIGIIGTLGEIILRSGLHSSGGNKKDDKSALFIILIGVGLLILGYMIFPLIKLAISRKREYLADAGSVELTKDKYAMIGALEKISQDPVIESIKKQTVAAMCIENPFNKSNGFENFFKNFLSTHPSIEKRIQALNNY